MGAGKTCCSLVVDPALSGPTDGRRDGGGPCTALSPGLRSGAWSPSLDGDLNPLTGVEWVGLVCAWGTSETCVSGYPAGIH